MAKGKKGASNRVAAQLLESSVAPILDIKYEDPLFTMALHPSKSILVTGLATGHIFCETYNSTALQELQQQKREEIESNGSATFATSKVYKYTKSISQSKSKWWLQKDNSEEDLSGNVVRNWSTKRHKGSCRHIIFEQLQSTVGEYVYSIGTDNVIKKAQIINGKVVAKVDTTQDFTDPKDHINKLCHSTTHSFLLAGTETGNVLIYDTKSNGLKRSDYKIFQANDDQINQILPMPDVSAYHYLTIGSTTLSHIDIRKGIITQSENQEDELLSMCYPSNDTKNDEVIVGHGEGIVTIWKNSKNRFADQLTRIKINKECSIESMVPTYNQDDDELANSIWCGDSDGLLHRINYKQGKIGEVRVHSAGNGLGDEVEALDIDFEYRLVSASMGNLKIWSNEDIEAGEEEEEEDDDDEDDDDSDVGGNGDDDDVEAGSDSDSFDSDDASDVSLADAYDDKSDEDDEDEEGDKDEDEEEGEGEENDDEEKEEDEEEEEEKQEIAAIVRRKRTDISQILAPSKKTKIVDLNKSTKPDPIEDEPVEDEAEESIPISNKKAKAEKVSAKQLKNMQKHEHGIRKFEGL
ncbi:hypothetical protein DFJ63DRAFT_248970 [Scheffersomyces coipomensis]|uniref:uncharacterized protein n=1 Tax=Scheffersomyces coipomensis TaxID=1788519 RepID=UPI00315CBE68